MMRVEVDKSSAPEPPPKPKRLMTSKEKYLEMRETNPLLQEMQKRFDLRPDEWGYLRFHTQWGGQHLFVVNVLCRTLSPDDL
jgi:hypothetical protein